VTRLRATGDIGVVALWGVGSAGNACVFRLGYGNSQSNHGLLFKGRDEMFPLDVRCYCPTPELKTPFSKRTPI
jgi:hypothetical protein